MRNVITSTGPEGARMFEIEMAKEAQRFILGRELTSEESDKITQDYREIYFEPGAYTIGKSGVEYNGLYDKDHSDGHFLKIRGDKHSIEQWENGKRINFKNISENEFNKLKQIYYENKNS